MSPAVEPHVDDKTGAIDLGAEVTMEFRVSPGPHVGDVDVAGLVV